MSVRVSVCVRVRVYVYAVNHPPIPSTHISAGARSKLSE